MLLLSFQLFTRQFYSAAIIHFTSDNPDPYMNPLSLKDDTTPRQDAVFRRNHHIDHLLHTSGFFDPEHFHFSGFYNSVKSHILLQLEPRPASNPRHNDRNIQEMAKKSDCTQSPSVVPGKMFTFMNNRVSVEMQTSGIICKQITPVISIYLNVSHAFFDHFSRIPISYKSQSGKSKYLINTSTWRKIINKCLGIENILKGLLATSHFFDRSIYHEIWFLKGLLENINDFKICSQSTYWNKFLCRFRIRNILFIEDSDTSLCFGHPTLNFIGIKFPIPTYSLTNPLFFEVPALLCVSFEAILHTFYYRIDQKFVNVRIVWVIYPCIDHLVTDRNTIRDTLFAKQKISFLKEKISKLFPFCDKAYIIQNGPVRAIYHYIIFIPRKPAELVTTYLKSCHEKFTGFSSPLRHQHLVIQGTKIPFNFFEVFYRSADAFMKLEFEECDLSELDLHNIISSSRQYYENYKKFYFIKFKHCSIEESKLKSLTDCLKMHFNVQEILVEQE